MKTLKDKCLHVYTGHIFILYILAIKRLLLLLMTTSQWIKFKEMPVAASFQKYINLVINKLTLCKRLPKIS